MEFLPEKKSFSNFFYFFQFSVSENFFLFFFENPDGKKIFFQNFFYFSIFSFENFFTTFFLKVKFELFFLLTINKMSPPIKNAVAVWDFTFPRDCGMDPEDVITFCKEFCKKWSFQVEEGESGYIHYQGRVSLKVKTRKPEKPCSECHWSVTSMDASHDDFYAVKKETRVDGPWTDKDPVPAYIPRQIREIKKLYPWQQKIIDKSKIWDTRSVDMLIDHEGCIGKSYAKGFMRAYGHARVLPFCNDYKDMMRMVMDMPTHTCYMIDMPRALKKDKVFQFFAAIESIKDGYAYDDRYQFKDKFFDSPNIWVFSNSKPDLSLLSTDRWRFWGVDSDKKLFRRDLTHET